MLQLRCTYCQTPFFLRREEALVALQEMSTGDLNHFDAHCPRCRRANQIPRNRLERAYPGWRVALDEMEKQTAKAEKEQAGKEEAVQVKEKTVAMKKSASKPAKTAAKPAADSSGKKSAPVKAKKPATAAKEMKPKAMSSATVKPSTRSKKK